MNLNDLLPVITPPAIEWVKERSKSVLEMGVALTPEFEAIARHVGVTRINEVRIQVVGTLPLPQDPLLQEVAVATGLLGPDMTGLTLGHGILICTGNWSRRLVSHELRHVAQYERAGSIDAFITEYLEQIARYGYWDAHLEQDARVNEID